MDDFKSFVEKVKDATDICDIISEDFRMDGRVVAGWRYSTARESLAANSAAGIYAWFSQSPLPGQKSSDDHEQGDVFVWLNAHRNMDFWQALEYLSQRVGMQMPKFNQQKSEAERKQVEARESLLDLATGWFERQLWSTAAALQYARGRGWSDVVIRSKTATAEKTTVFGAALGYSGGTPAATADLRSYLMAAGCDVTTPEAVALIGMKGGVLPWCQAHGLEPEKGWLEQDRIYGITDFPRLVYPVRKYGQGKTLYHHCRNLEWQDGGLRGVKDGEEKPKMHNPHKKLMGDRPLFLNHCFNKAAQMIVIVEGPADAVSLGQWKTAGIALNGLGASDVLTRLLISDKMNAVKEGRVYLALDNDERGRAANEKVADLLGGMVKMVTWRHLQ